MDKRVQYQTSDVVTVIQIIFQKLFSCILYLLTYFQITGCRVYRNPTTFYVIFWVDFLSFDLPLLKNLQNSLVRLTTVLGMWRCSPLLPSNTVIPSLSPWSSQSNYFQSLLKVETIWSEVYWQTKHPIRQAESCFLPIGLKSCISSLMHFL